MNRPTDDEIRKIRDKASSLKKEWGKHVGPNITVAGYEAIVDTLDWILGEGLAPLEVKKK